MTNGCSVERIAVRRYVIHADGNDVAAAQLAVDGKVEQGEVTRSSIDLQLGPDRPNVAWPEGRLRPW